MKVGDLYYLWNIPKCKALVTDIYSKRKFHQSQNHFNDFPSITITSYVKIVVVSGKHKGSKEIHIVEDFNQFFRKIEVENESR